MQRHEALELFGAALCGSALLGAPPAAAREIARKVQDQLRESPARRRLVLDEHQDRTVTTIAETNS